MFYSDGNKIVTFDLSDPNDVNVVLTQKADHINDFQVVDDVIYWCSSSTFNLLNLKNKIQGRWKIHVDHAEINPVLISPMRKIAVVKTFDL